MQLRHEVNFWVLWPLRCLQTLYLKKYIYYVLFTQRISQLPGSFEIHWVGQYLVNFMSLVGIVNATVYIPAIFHRAE